jgi:ATP-dependent RNA helicase DHX37/DHR1
MLFFLFLKLIQITIHFSKRTAIHNYVQESFIKVERIHKRLPPGAILVFLTGQQEIRHLCQLLQRRFSNKKELTPDKKQSLRVSSSSAEIELDDIPVDEMDTMVDDRLFDSDDDDEYEDRTNEKQFDGPLYVLPLYSLLPNVEQLRVFAAPPEGSRLCVVATNVAETSLTIPGVRYVVDCGRAKERYIDKESSVQKYRINWISKASAQQRAGRSGRTAPGHVYRLYSSAVYERDFPEFAHPEILTLAIDGKYGRGSC